MPGKFVSARAELFNDDGTRATTPQAAKTAKMYGICFDITDRANSEEQRVAALQKGINTSLVSQLNTDLLFLFIAEETQRLRATDLENYKRELEEFVNTICHEIRNPLNGLKGSLEWLRETEGTLAHVIESSGAVLPTQQREQLGNALRVSVIHQRCSKLSIRD